MCTWACSSLCSLLHNSQLQNMLLGCCSVYVCKKKKVEKGPPVRQSELHRSVLGLFGELNGILRAETRPKSYSVARCHS